MLYTIRRTSTLRTPSAPHTTNSLFFYNVFCFGEYKYCTHVNVSKGFQVVQSGGVLLQEVAALGVVP